ncbi:hypothetical protein GE061_003283 [Apolygus lucorum]|uniref:Reverse transcriptase domain-containing protein n=1 Tax=Apolygus lucorum TaxID=248454 RepID=A0A8S9X1L7_APOLU|nr:hypothetical protein GE061_003283 [Apolygus lucorum]
MAKTYSGLLARRLEDFVEQNSIMTEAQAGFRKGYSTVDAIFTLTGAAHLRLENGPKKKLYAFFVDYRSAFDSVRHDLLLEKLNVVGVSRKFLRTLAAMYGVGQATVWGRQGLSQFFDIERGVKQGFLMSPLLFAIYLNDLTQAIPFGTFVGENVISTLLYADDVAVLAESPEDLQSNIEALKSYSDRWSLEVNLDKSKVMVFRRGGRLSAKEKWFYEGKKLDTVSSFRYLGVSLKDARFEIPQDGCSGDNEERSFLGRGDESTRRERWLSARFEPGGSRGLEGPDRQNNNRTWE